jgi:hypothetical protein
VRNVRKRKLLKHVSSSAPDWAYVGPALGWLFRMPRHMPRRTTVRCICSFTMNLNSYTPDERHENSWRGKGWCLDVQRSSSLKRSPIAAMHVVSHAEGTTSGPTGDHNRVLEPESCMNCFNSGENYADQLGAL